MHGIARALGGAARIALAPYAAHATLKRVSEPEDVAGLVVGWPTHEAHFVTGAPVTTSKPTACEV